ncbi:threonine/serine exporter family protein [Leifsonia shinshuensis]|uniref:threonine/serine ThrE exporter family protein n=1 Tax=Leifsonia shinshuensis TaxID=150026 RepID=UPI002866D1A0|nr:threonine/serine exporter family protein [Leifsonia shinshuensis]MDR6972681.1 uncharacterized membrane protein YjjP (DUF1212 family) [Leifsonia shinshuensis]
MAGALAVPAPTTARVTVASLTEMLGGLGAALLQSARATSAVERILHDVAASYGREDIRSYVLPTLVLVEDAGSAPERTTLHASTGRPLRLDQTGAVEQLITRAIETRPAPVDVLAELSRIRASRPRFGSAVRIAGHTLLSLGFGMVLDPVAAAIPVYLIFGLLVGVIVEFGSRVRTLALLLPTVTAFGMTAVAGGLVAPMIDEDPVRLVAPALVSFIPGLTMTLAAVELTSAQVVAGASRLVYGAAQLGLLAFGVYAALTMTGAHPIIHSSPQLGRWAAWVGIPLTAAGYLLFSVAPRKSFVWILAALVIAYGAQQLSGALVGAEFSGFVGAIVVIFAVSLFRRMRSAPPSSVMLTCAYWLLVPGALGFVGLGTAAERGGHGAVVLGEFVVSLLAIAIGMVVGAGLTSDAAVAAEAWRDAGADVATND